jgi:hypothetical protein
MMHLPRPDSVIRTSVIQPMWTRFISPVDIARHTIDPFIASVRGPGPQVVPTPDPNSIAAAAQQVASHFTNGQSATINVGGQSVTVSMTTPASGGLIGVITQAAQQLASGQAVAIQVGPYKVIVLPGDDSSANGTSSNTDATSGVSTDSNVTATTSTPAPSSGFGAPIMNSATLPQIPAPTGTRPLPWPAQGIQWRQQNYTDNPMAWSMMQATNAAAYAPFAVQRVADLDMVPVQWAQQQSAPALASRTIPATQANVNTNPFVPRLPVSPNQIPQPSQSSSGFGAAQFGIRGISQL